MTTQLKDKHSVNCFFCDEVFDEQECPKDSGGYNICEDCSNPGSQSITLDKHEMVIDKEEFERLVKIELQASGKDKTMTQLNTTKEYLNCSHCGSTNTEHLENVMYECYDCGNTFPDSNSQIITYDLKVYDKNEHRQLKEQETIRNLTYGQMYTLKSALDRNSIECYVKEIN